MRHIPLTLVTLVLVCGAGAARAQESDSRPLEGTSIGAMGAAGLFGNIGAVRLSTPLDRKWGLDITAGQVGGRASPTNSGLEGYNFGAQVRWHWHGRRATGASGYWLAGPLVQGMTERTVIVWPDRVTTVLTERKAAFTLQVGYGWDWLMTSGVRFGVELVTGGTAGGPNPYVNAFVVWGRPRRASD